MKPEYYKEYFFLERNHWWFKIRGQIIERHIKTLLKGCTNPSIKILNIGAATGYTTELLNQYGDVTSVENDYECCVFVEQHLGMKFINASALDLPFADGSFDIVCAFDVLEHIENDRSTVDEMMRICKSGGWACITVPGFMQLWSHHDEVNEHKRRYTIKSLLRLFDNNSGTLVYKTYFNSLLFIPIYVFRITSNIFFKNIKREGAGSDFTLIKQNSIINRIMFLIFKTEYYLLKFFRFRFGVSILVTLKK